jgi:hypothetical protein
MVAAQGVVVGPGGVGHGDVDALGHPTWQFHLMLLYVGQRIER